MFSVDAKAGLAQWCVSQSWESGTVPDSDMFKITLKHGFSRPEGTLLRQLSFQCCSGWWFLGKSWFWSWGHVVSVNFHISTLDS